MGQKSEAVDTVDGEEGKPEVESDASQNSKPVKKASALKFTYLDSSP